VSFNSNKEKTMSHVVTYGWGNDRKATPSMSKNAAAVAKTAIESTDSTLKPKIEKFKEDGKYNA
tara:strand:+ start:2491 stop:2682 length:192 start_codon:yes stop_codon:yes gene_type:complete